MCKILTSLVRNRIYDFLCRNKYIETNIQKGFWTGISGTIEHTETMSYLINHARLKQRSITITLLDLKNAFGEVHHELLRSGLKYHQIPREIEKLIFLLYKDFHIAISANNFTTPLIHVQKGVLQGDCLSPLLFNMCVNTLIKTIDNEKLKCLGYLYDNTITPKH